MSGRSWLLCRTPACCRVCTWLLQAWQDSLCVPVQCQTGGPAVLLADCAGWHAEEQGNVRNHDAETIGLARNPEDAGGAVRWHINIVLLVAGCWGAACVEPPASDVPRRPRCAPAHLASRPAPGGSAHLTCLSTLPGWVSDVARSRRMAGVPVCSSAAAVSLLLLCQLLMSSADALFV